MIMDFFTGLINCLMFLNVKLHLIVRKNTKITHPIAEFKIGTTFCFFTV